MSNLLFNYSLNESLVTNTMLQSDIKRYQNAIKELENLNQVLRDEHQALQLAFAALEEKLRKAQVNFVCWHCLCQKLNVKIVAWVYFVNMY